MSEKYKVVVIGGGPGGYVAALRASQLGARTALIEKQQVGGTCLQRGCIPSKSLLAGAEFFYKIKERAKNYGIFVTDLGFDFVEMNRRKDKVVRQFTQAVQSLLKNRKVDLFPGTGSLRTNGEVEVEPQQGEKALLHAEKIILATGSEPSRPVAFPFNSQNVLTSTEALQLKDVPPVAVIIGAGAVGCEFATIWVKLGSQVTLIEKMPQVLPGEDSESAAFLEKALVRQGVSVHLGISLEKVQPLENGRAKVVLSTGDIIEADVVLIAIGRQLNTKGLGLEALGVEINNGSVVVNSKMETNIANLYAVGDMTGQSLLAHSAFAQGEIAAENALGGDKEFDAAGVPRCIYTSPEVASIGLSEKQLQEKGIHYTVGKYPFSALGKAHIEGDTAGQVKFLVESGTDKILGFHIVGPHATELIHEGVLGLKLGAKIQDIADMIHAHPTLSEAVGEAAKVLLGRPLHL